LTVLILISQVVFFICSTAIAADEQVAAQANAPTSERPFKLTLGYYDHADFGGEDINLRRRSDDTSLWIGYYHDPEFGRQLRGGWDTSIQPNAASSFSIQPSLQLASRGFVSGSLNFQVGSPWYALAGIGRTNLRPYANLNFDPNDALTFAVGHQDDDGRTFYLMLIADDRLGTQQRHLHAVARLPRPRGERFTFDVLRKQGQGDEGYLRAWGVSATYDFPSWFVRLAYDEKQNFGARNVTRLSAGIRF
jgi:hypothetical protein